MARFFSAFIVAIAFFGSTTFLFANDASVVVKAFQEHVTESDFESALQKSANDRIGAFEESPADAITEGLIALYPKYAAAVDSSEEDDIEKAGELLKPFVDSEDQFLAADASFYMARLLMNNERFEDALPLLAKIKTDYIKVSVHNGVTDYFSGIAHAGLLQKDSAINSFVNFLENHPEAPERMRVSAWRQVQRLQSIKDGKLDDAHQKMEFSRRRLAIENTDESTQGEQEKIVKILTKLIKEEEKKECSGSCKNCKKSGKSQKPGAGNKQANNKSQQQKQDGKKGDKAKAQDGKAVVKTYDDVPASPWSRLRDRSRDPANNAIKEKLPSRYRDIVEKYMEKANGTEEGSGGR